MGTAERPAANGDPGAIGPIAFVGCGPMGAPMARRLLGAGAALRCFDDDEAALAATADAGARRAASPQDAARGATVAITMLPDPTVVERAARGPEGLLAGLESGGLWLEMSSSRPATTQALAAAAAKALAVGMRAGLDPERFVDCVDGGTGASHAMRAKVGGHVLTGMFGSRFTLGQYLRDLGIARGLADDHRAPTPVNGAAHALWTEQAARGHAEEDHTRMVALLLADAGVERDWTRPARPASGSQEAARAPGAPSTTSTAHHTTETRRSDRGCHRRSA